MKRPTKATAIERIQKALEAVPELEPKPYNSHDFKKWHRDTRLAIEHTFIENPNSVDEFSQISFLVRALFARGTNEEYIRRRNQEAYVKGLRSASALLESMIDEIKNYWGDDDQIPSSHVQEIEPPITNEVFLVHGRDEGTKSMVVRFLERLDLQPIVLADQPNRGFTVIEKFERHHAHVPFAVILLTPDDSGALKGEEQSLRPRARQNVIFELGYFFGRLGRKRVCALTKDDVEIPSDYAGVVYIPFDDHGGWQLALSRELQAAGFNIDANRVL